MPRGVTTTKECSHCGKQVSLFAYNRHLKSHQSKPVIPPATKRTECKYCGGKYEGLTSLGNHEYRCKANPDRKPHILTPAGRQSIIDKNRNRKWSDEKRARHKESMRMAVLKNPDSYSAENVCGRVKLVEYNGERFHGEWEVEVAKWFDRAGIRWNREVKPIPYEWNNSWHLYFPDFYLPELDLYVEVKGYETDRDRSKWSVLKNLVVIKQKDIEDIRNNRFRGFVV